jgi:uncharacterized repeat protein (TIGR03803 family)
LQGPTLPFLGSADEFFDHTPYRRAVQGNDGNFYGAVQGGGAYGLGTVVKITPSGTLTVLHTFIGSDGAHLVATLAQ